MKRCVPFLLAAMAAPAGFAQMSNGPAPPPSPVSAQTVEVESEGKCRDARPGDTVNFTLTIESVESAKAVYAELELHEGHAAPVRTSGGLPLPDYRRLAGGGLGTRDAQTSTLFHFTFRVPAQVYSGLYRGVNVLVTADRPIGVSDRDRGVDVTRHAHNEVKNFCLRVISGYGNDGRPVVTDFQPGDVQRPAPLPGAPR